MIALNPPAMPAQKKYQKWGFYLSHGFINVFRFSFENTIMLINGIFINTVTG